MAVHYFVSSSQTAGWLRHFITHKSSGRKLLVINSMHILMQNLLSTNGPGAGLFFFFGVLIKFFFLYISIFERNAQNLCHFEAERKKSLQIVSSSVSLCTCG